MRFIATLSLVAAAVTGFSSGATKVNGIAATANGELVTMNEVMIKLAPMQSVLMAESPRRGPAYEQTLGKLRNQILDELIDRAIIFSEYKDRIKAIPDHVVEEEIEKTIRNVYTGNRKEFRDYLKAATLTYEQYKEQQRKEILVSVIKGQQFGDPAPPTNTELRSEYSDWAIANRDRTKDVGTYRKIYISKGDPNDISVTPENQLALAEGLVEKLKAGSDFSATAKEYSKDSKSEEGGLWENVPRTDLNREFGFLVFETKGSEVMGPFEDQRGFTIFEVINRKLGPAESFSEAMDNMKIRVNNKKKNTKFKAWMKKLRDRVPVKKFIK